MEYADGLTGSIDGWEYKSYVLDTMFYLYIFEKYIINYINKTEKEAGNIGFDYSLISDEEAEEVKYDIVKETGFFFYLLNYFLIYKNILIKIKKVLLRI